ncbi:MAG: hypothetical protein NTX75_11520 [Proteobacteria bacterium]|nr:hypothetical protein [Pseudomonadota bacterium]
MKKTAQTRKKSSLVNAIISSLEKNEIFAKIVSLKHNSERQIQMMLFLQLERELPSILSSHFGFSEKKSTRIVKEGFKWEQKIATPVPSFNFFATNHHPDSVLEINEKLRIAMELKKGDSGQSLRSGIGQALVYSTQFNFIIYLLVDTTPAQDIKSSVSADKEQALINSLWKNYNVKFIVV